MEKEKMVGKIKSIVYSQKFGYIRGKNKKDYYFRFEDVKGPFEHMYLKNTVTFDCVETDKSPRAVNVVPDEYEKHYIVHWDENPGGTGWYFVLFSSDQKKASPGYWNGEYWSDIDPDVGWRYIYPVGWMRMEYPTQEEWK